jgi:hypothetical protein
VPLLCLHIFYGTCSSNVIKFTVSAGDRGATRQSFMLGCTASCVACRHSQWGTKGLNSLFIAYVGSLHALCTNTKFQLSF